MSQSMDWEFARLDDIAEELKRLVQRLKDEKCSPSNSHRPAISMRSLSPLLPRYAAMAKADYDARRGREAFIDPVLLGEAVWDILLDLYVNQVAGRRISVTSACVAAAVPPTTALRYLTLLERRGLLVRQDDLFDQRRTYVQLSDRCFLDMTRYFAERDRTFSSQAMESIEDDLILTDVASPPGMS